MVMTYDESVEFEKLKQDNKKEIMRLEMANNREMHKMRLEALHMQLDIEREVSKPIEVSK